MSVRVNVFVIVIFGIVFACLILLFFLRMGLLIETDAKHLSPCGYGASETMVREKDGRARIVCACR